MNESIPRRRANSADKVAEFRQSPMLQHQSQNQIQNQNQHQHPPRAHLADNLLHPTGAVRVELETLAADYRHHPYASDMIPGYAMPYLFMQKTGAPQTSPTSHPRTSADSAGLVRKQRRTQACDWCHSKRIKCEGGNPCNSCTKRDIRCQWRKMKRRGPKPRTHAQISAAAQPVKKTIKHKPSAADLSNLLAPDTSKPNSVRDSSPEKSVGSEALSPGKTVVAEPNTPASECSSLSEGIVAPPPIGSLVEDFFSDKVDADTREALLAFFDYIYAFLPVFHPSTFIRRVVAGDVNPLLIDIIKALSAPYIKSGAYNHIDAQQLIDNVKARILFAIETPTIDVIHAVFFLYITEMRHERATSFSALMSVAIGTIIKLGWHEIDLYKTKKAKTWDEWVDAETKRRTFWCIIHGDFNRFVFPGPPSHDS
ncbi:hypothetical protein DL89DRAFT_125644 [Linderina pennispora]|uniref:Zn(2)-C6 fungal-type domain-containing protein n=1 Tax=Linderina pennispora TaxID=61395 RepID=A0A1Y1WD46_9FUNG|nr:uncharacterized protein DL89DRAFT_125644 [Linderina pennispora]ORX71451.1 hypothetical protein DL89DRAFT_125644 [Linderina pennispora]